MLPNEIKYRYKINLMINDEGRKESTVNMNSNLYANKTNTLINNIYRLKKKKRNETKYDEINMEERQECV